MQTISVPLKSRSYPIWIENGLIDKLPDLLKPLNQGQKWVLFSQNGIFNHYGEELVRHLNKAKFSVETIFIPDGEDGKSFTELENIYTQLISTEPFFHKVS